MQEIVALEIEETKAVVGGVKIGEPPVVGFTPSRSSPSPPKSGGAADPSAIHFI